MLKKERNLFLYVAFLLLAGFFYLFTNTTHLFFNTLMFSLNFMIYAGLLLFWIQSVTTRLLPTKARTYVVAAAMLMITYLLLRVVKYRIGFTPFLCRTVSYMYYVPMVLIPTLFFMTCFRIYFGETREEKWREEFFLIPAGLMSILVLTNDLHTLVYRPNIPIKEFSVVSGTYGHGLIIYLLYAWMVLMILGGIGLLLYGTKKHHLSVLVELITLISFWAVMTTAIKLNLPLNLIRKMYKFPELSIFCLLGVFEICIRHRLIPHNENYAGYFAQLGLPVMITDQNRKPTYRTSVEIKADEKQLSASLKAPVYLDEDTRLSGMEIHAGYAFWTEDEAELHKENQRLEAANELLSEENNLIKAENELKEKQAHLDAQNLVYDRIAATLYPKQKQIHTLLQNITPGTEEFRHALAQCCVLNAYSKRKGNLLLLSEDTLPKRNRELFLALQESARYLKCLGVEAAAVGEEYSELPLETVQDLYDSFESLLEENLGRLRRMTTSVIENGVRLAMEVSEPPVLPKTKCDMVLRESEDCYFLTIRERKGGDAS